MKTRGAKVLLSLLAMAAIGFATANAYTFEVNNREPFGVLNLSKLIIKDLTHTGIILDVDNYTIKISHGDGVRTGQIRVYEICDQDGNHCKNVADLGNGGGSYTAGNGINISDENVISSVLNTAKTDGHVEAGEKYPNRIRKTDENGVPGWRTGDGGSRQLNTKEQAGYVATGGEEFIGKVRKVDENGEPNWGKDEVGEGGGVSADGHINEFCYLNAENELLCDNEFLNTLYPAPGAGTIKIKQGDSERTFNVNQNGDQEINIDNGNEVAHIEGQIGKWCRYYCKHDGESFFSRVMQGETVTIPDAAVCGIFCDQDEPTDNPISIQGDPGKLCEYVSPTAIYCNTDYVPGGGGGGGNSLWKTGTYTTYDFDGQTKSRVVLTPDLVVGQYSGLYFTNSFYHSSGFHFFTNQSDAGLKAASRIDFDAKGIRINDGRRIFTGAGLAVGGAVVVGNSSTQNFIYINATGNYISPDKHFEILGNQELAIGTRSGAFVYFQNYYSGDDEAYRVGVNTKSPKATLDVKGSIKINTDDYDCFPTSCTEDTAGSIIFRNNEFYGCKKNSSNQYRWHKFSTTSTSNQQRAYISCSSLASQIPAIK